MNIFQLHINGGRHCIVQPADLRLYNCLHRLFPPSGKKILCVTGRIKETNEHAKLWNLSGGQKSDERRNFRITEPLKFSDKKLTSTVAT
jgi:hypothetical protein